MFREFFFKNSTLYSIKRDMPTHYTLSRLLKDILGQKLILKNT